MAKLTQRKCQGEAVPPGEIKIQQRDVEPAIHRFRQCSQPMHGMHHTVTSVGRQAADHLGHGRVVFHQQDAQRLACKQLDLTGSDVRAGAVDRQGRSTVNRVPTPSRLPTRIRPFIATVSSWQIASPSPLPPSRELVRAASPCSKRWNNRFCCSGPTPGPLAHREAQGISMLADGERHLAAVGKLDRIAQQVDQDLTHPRRIAHDHHMRGELIAVLEAQAARVSDGGA